MRARAVRSAAVGVALIGTAFTAVTIVGSSAAGNCPPARCWFTSDTMAAGLVGDRLERRRKSRVPVAFGIVVSGVVPAVDQRVDQVGAPTAVTVVWMPNSGARIDVPGTVASGMK